MHSAFRNLMLASVLALPHVPALATLPLRMPLGDMVGHADHILIGRVNGVDMVDDGGRMISDLKASTGPCQDKVIRLRVEVDDVLVTDAKRVPKVLFIPLDRLMHFSLGQVQEAHKGDRAKRLVLLKGTAFRPVAPGVHFAALAEKEEALRLYKSRRKKLDEKYRDEDGAALAARMNSDACAAVRPR